MLLSEGRHSAMAGQIFSGNINAMATSWMMIYMLMFAVAWEAWCGFLTKRAGENRAQQEMLSKVGRELMILGFIAFGVILLKELNVFVWNSDTLLTFEFCDLLISICVLICASTAPTCCLCGRRCCAARRSMYCLER